MTKKEYDKKYYLEHKEKKISNSREWKKKNPEKHAAQLRKHFLIHKKEINAYKRKVRGRYKKREREYNKKWCELHPEKRREQANRCERNRRKRDPVFKLSKNFSAYIRISLNKKKCGKHWKEIVGYSLENLIQRLEYQFDKNMSWNNYGSYWHIDHKKPRSLFNYSNPDDQTFKDCWCLANLQPMEAKENRRKGNQFFICGSAN